jgi:hypothetical protein
MTPPIAVEGRSRADYLMHCERVIESVGWIVQSAEGRASDFGWCHTVGLARLGHPELVIAGLPAEIATELLNTVASDVVAATKSLSAGDELGDVAPMPLRVVAIDPAYLDERFAVARDIEEDEFAEHGAFQLVWPDAGGLFPWEGGSECPTQGQWGLGG